jgi:hypothetical protein
VDSCRYQSLMAGSDWGNKRASVRSVSLMRPSGKMVLLGISRRIYEEKTSLRTCIVDTLGLVRDETHRALCRRL